MLTSDLNALSNAAIESEIAILSAQIDTAEHRLLTLVRELHARQRHRDHGLPSMAAWLNWRVGLGPVAAREKVRVARALGELPEIDAAFAKAEVSYSKVRAMTRIATPESEGRLLHMAKNASAAQLETICRGVEQVTSRTREGHSRWVKLRRCSDGMVRLEARLHPDEAALVMKAVDAAVEEAPAPDAPDACAEALPPSEARPDGLIRVAEAFLAGQRPDARPGGERHQIIVCVREGPLVPGNVSAEADDAGQVLPETLRRLACDASLTRMTDRRILDKQIRDTIRQYAQVGATVGHAEHSGDLRKFIAAGKRSSSPSSSTKPIPARAARRRCRWPCPRAVRSRKGARARADCAHER